MNGVLLVDKEQSWTSSDVVVKLKGILRQRRVGHAGTLDPMATGLLVVFAGRATRAVEFAERDSKRYLASLRLGTVTDTQDVWGTVLEKNAADVGRDELEAALKRFRGAQEQLPPMYSAVKVNGKKLCDVARRGGEVERRPRSIVIHELTLLGQSGEDWLLDVRCSKGTYIRTLCHDIGQALGCGGCMSALRRRGSWKNGCCRWTGSLPGTKCAAFRQRRRRSSAAGAAFPPRCRTGITASTVRAGPFSCSAGRRTAACTP